MPQFWKITISHVKPDHPTETTEIVLSAMFDFVT
jgi:hypothetical protein